MWISKLKGKFKIWFLNNITKENKTIHFIILIKDAYLISFVTDSLSVHLCYLRWGAIKVRNLIRWNVKLWKINLRTVKWRNIILRKIIIGTLNIYESLLKNRTVLPWPSRHLTIHHKLFATRVYFTTVYNI